MESNTKEDKDKEEENLENDEINDKGTYISNNIKNKLTISIKPKSKLIKQISSSSLEDKGEEKIKEKEENEKIPNKNKKANALINILKKLQKKKSEEQQEENNEEEEENNNNNNQNDIDINESENERKKIS